MRSSNRSYQAFGELIIDDQWSRNFYCHSWDHRATNQKMDKYTSSLLCKFSLVNQTRRNILPLQCKTTVSDDEFYNVHESWSMLMLSQLMETCFLRQLAPVLLAWVTGAHLSSWIFWAWNRFQSSFLLLMRRFLMSTRRRYGNSLFINFYLPP